MRDGRAIDNFLEIIKHRAEPGIMVFNREGRLLFSNRGVVSFLAELQKEQESADSFQEAICSFCRKLRIGSLSPTSQTGVGQETPMLDGISVAHYVLRPFLIGDAGSGSLDTHVLILIENVVEKRTVDFDKARTDFNLTRRETEVVGLICKGFTNKEIAKTKFISEYTVKVHIKNILKKMKAGSRSEVVAQLK